MTTLADLAHFDNYDPSSFGWKRGDDGGPLVPLQVKDPKTGVVVNFGQCAKAVHDVMVALITEVAANIQGGLEQGRCWCYATTDDLPDGSYSFHHYGIASDIDWDVNHMGTNIPDPLGMHAIPRGPATRIALKYGFEWGGNWSGGFHDLMHFECHLSPNTALNYRKYLPGPIAAITRKSGWPLSFVPGNVFGPLDDPSPKVHGGATAKERAYVKVIQGLLYTTGDAPRDGSWKPEGIWGPGTTAVVKKWQARTGQKVTGVINRSNWKALTS